MKKITISIVAAIFAVGAIAQTINIQSEVAYPSAFHFNNDRVVDTLMGPVFYTTLPCIDTVVYYNVGSGYLTGQFSLSGFSSKECSQGIGFTGAGQLTGIIGWLAPISGTSGSFKAKVYQVDASMKPTTAIATSNNFSMAALTPQQINEVPFTFASPVNVNGNFAIAVEYPTTAGDTIVVFQTRLGCVDPTKDGYAYVNLGVAGWMQYKTIVASQGGSFDLFLAAVVNITSSGVQDNKVAQQASVYPVPAKDQITIASLNKINTYKILNSLGQVVKSEKIDAHTALVNVSEYKEGVYFVQLETVEGSVTKRFIVTK